MISIAMATYNGEKFVSKQLQSLALQHVLPIELVICDDASTDGTLKAVEAFASNAPFPVHVHVNDTRLGYRSNFMKAASLCRGELISFCDQDDVWYPEKLAEVEKRFANPGVLLVHHNARLVDAQGNGLGNVHNGHRGSDATFECMHGNPWHFPLGFAITFRHELLELSKLRMDTTDYFNEAEHLAHDQWIYLLAWTLGQTSIIARPLVDYRQHASNTYGLVKTKRNLIGRWAGRFEKFANYKLYAKVCDQIAAVLVHASTFNRDQSLQNRAALGAARFKELGQLYRKRATVYDGTSAFKRMTAWFSLLVSGGYGTLNFWSFDKREIARDLVLGVCLARQRHRDGQHSSRDWSIRTNGRPERPRTSPAGISLQGLGA